MLKKIRLVYDKKLSKKVKELQDNVSFENYDGTAAYIKVELYGYSLLEANIHIKGLQPTFRYEVFFFRDQIELEAHRANAPTKAKEFIKQNIGLPEEPYEPDVTRPVDFFITNHFKANSVYKGHWLEVDMNSAEPYYVAEKCPTLKPMIYKLYETRKSNPVNKLKLNCINGNLRNSHVSVYRYVVNTLFDKMTWVMNTLEKYGAIPFCMRRDAVIAMVPKDFKIPVEIPIGTKIGEFKAIRDYGTIETTDSDFIYYTDMKKISTKAQGTLVHSELDNLVIYCNKILKKGLRVKTVSSHLRDAQKQN